MPAGMGSASLVYRSPVLMLLPADRSHRTEIRGETWSLEIDSGLWREQVEDLRSEGVILPREPAAVALDGDDGGYLETVYRHLKSDLNFSGLHFELYAINTVRGLLLLIHRRLDSRPEDRPVWSISDAVSYIEIHYEEQFSLDFFSGKCAMNHSSLSRRFKEATGFPLFEYINRVKIRHACVYLKREDRSVLDIAIGLGYNSISFFNRYFRRVTGLSPSEFRKLK